MHTPIGPTEATIRWKTACIRLSEAIQEFSEATSTFTRVIFDPASPDEVGFDIQSTLEDIDLELPLLASDDEIFTAAHMRVKEARNNSKRIIPIHRLPLEVLSHIFHTVIAWADDCCERNGTPCTAPVGSGLGWKTCTISLTSVCSTWRHVIVETPSCWSHIDVRLAVEARIWWYIPTEYSKLCLQRASNAPLQLHIYLTEEGEMREKLSDSRSIDYFGSQTVSSIIFEFRWASLARQSIIDIWMSTLANPVTSLKIQASQMLNIEKLPADHMHEHLHTLDLVGITGETDWSQIRFPGLVNLSLSANDHLPMDQLRDILVASPALCTLIINGKNASVDDLVKFEGAPVELGRLIFLGIGEAGAFDIILLLQMIKPAPKCTALSLSCSREHDRFKFEADEESHIRMWQTIQTFCIQHNVSNLSLDVSKPHASAQLSLPHFLHSLTNLHTLALWNTSIYLDDDVTSQFDESTHAYEYMAPPALQRLYLNHTAIPVELWYIISASSILWLRMDYCYFGEHKQVLVEWLEGSVPEFHLHGEGKVSNVVCSSDCELPWWLSALNAGLYRHWEDDSRLYM